MHTCDAFLNVFALTDDLREKQKCSGMRKRRRVSLPYQFCSAKIIKMNGGLQPGFAVLQLGEVAEPYYGDSELR